MILFYMPRGRGVRRARENHPYGGVVGGRGQVRRRNRREPGNPAPAVNEEQQPDQQPPNAPVPRQEPVQRQEPVPVVQRQEPVPVPVATCNIAVQADNNVINGEDFLSDNTHIANNISNDPLIVPMNNEIDLFVNQSMKEKIWGLQYVNLALLLHQNFDVPNEPKVNGLTVLNGNVVVNSENRNLKIKHIENINAWTDAFCNFSKIVIQRHPMLASDLFSYMALIRGAVSDASFERVYQYDQQFRLRVAQNPTRSWSQIDGNLWFRFVAKGALGGQIIPSQSFQKFCYDYNFRKGCFRINCLYRHSCLKCYGMHPSVLCTHFKNMQNNQQLNIRKNVPRQPIANQINQIRAPFQQPRLGFRAPAVIPNSIRY